MNLESVQQFAVLGLGVGELILIAVVALVLFGANKIPPFMRGLKQGVDEFKHASENLQDSSKPKIYRPVGEALTTNNQTVEDTSLPAPEEEDNLGNAMTLWIAQGFGIGRIPFAPGTFGSVLGLGWFALLLWPGDFGFYCANVAASIAASVWFCGRAEIILKRTDPPSVVLDEISAIPVCFAGWVAFLFFKTGRMPAPEYFFSSENWLWTLGVFVLFRVFDIAKPWPVRQSQRLPGGWGVTVDDILAALYVNLVVGAVALARGWLAA
ncbi:MAG: phosphatidylglycerophosphatase A [Verrucomicrobia bacterium]|nr:phosphatidylglycerophosphatase A [Verrucomicrobiota bacterium]